MTGKTQKQPLISIVDDDDLVRAGISRLVRSMGYATCAFAAAEDFLQSSERHDTSCLICDIQLPGITGLDLQRELGSDECAPPIIFMTAYPDVFVRNRALAAGAICFLNKPLTGHDLKKCLERALSPV
jgi:FixJ family two-component response regulator